MIEIIYDETEQGKESPEVPVRLPKNLRQVGEGTVDTKIYIEDYVMTFIRKFWEKEDTVTAGILLGEVKQSGKETYIFVPGAIAIDRQQISFEDGQIQFTDDTWSSIYSTVKQFFNRYMIVGWFVNRNEPCREVGQGLGKVHLDNFPGADKILFLADTSEKEEKVYRYENGTLMEQPVYYIYYERNEDMQEYMLAGKQGETKASLDAEVKDVVPQSYRNILKEKKEENSQRRLVGVLYGACTFLAIVILMIGVAMMNNYDKIESLERLVSDLYKTAMGQVQPSREEPGKESDELIIGKVDGKVEPTTVPTDVNEPESTSVQDKEAQQTLEKVDDKQPESKEPETEPASEQSTETMKEPESIVTGDIIEETQGKEGEMYHIVKEGDTLTSISRRFYNTDTMVEKIKELNEISNQDIIYPGQVIRLP